VEAWITNPKIFKLCRILSFQSINKISKITGISKERIRLMEKQKENLTAEEFYYLAQAINQPVGVLLLEKVHVKILLRNLAWNCLLKKKGLTMFEAREALGYNPSLIRLFFLKKSTAKLYKW
jgi:hypothetical protein